MIAADFYTAGSSFSKFNAVMIGTGTACAVKSVANQLFNLALRTMKLVEIYRRSIMRDIIDRRCRIQAPHRPHCQQSRTPDGAVPLKKCCRYTCPVFFLRLQDLPISESGQLHTPQYPYISSHSNVIASRSPVTTSCAAESR